ncbi:MAG: hypothetical protein KatS3mg001_010 [Candidatus Pacearchaeota archaeon]|nr:MAG: hypothetical protein KatS3mg001_010 [Candidatus Pacearchaeota archaeon]
MEKDIGRIKKNEFSDIVVRIDDFGGKKGLTIREFVTGQRYTGFTKSGVKIPLADFEKFKEIINSINIDDFNSEGDNSEESSQDTSETSEKEEIEDY